MNTISQREWSLSFRNQANGANALGKNRVHDEYSPGLDRTETDMTHVLGQNISPELSMVVISWEAERS